MSSTKFCRSFMPSYEKKKKNGDDYEPDCLKVKQASLERYLKSKAYSKFIIPDREFFNSRKVLEGKARKPREQGKGKTPKQSRRLTKEEEEVLWQNGHLRGGTPRALLNSMWWLPSLSTVSREVFDQP